MLHLYCRFETRPDLRVPSTRQWKANNNVSVKYEAMLYPNLRAELVEKMKSDRLGCGGGPTDKRDTQGKNCGVRLLHHSTLWTSWSWSPSYFQQHEETGGIFQIPEGYLHTCSESGKRCTEALGKHLCFRPPKRRYNFNLSDWLIDTVQTTKTNWVNICPFVSIDVTSEVTHRGKRLYGDKRKLVGLDCVWAGGYFGPRGRNLQRNQGLCQIIGQSHY